MSNSFARTFRSAAVGGVALMALLPALAAAQESSADPQSIDASKDDIVVTGTLIRGAAPVGQTVISVGPAQAQAQGAATSNEILATIPQITNLFSTVPNSRLGVAAIQIQVVRPNLRNLSPETGSSASTLVLFDGHRLAGAGVTQSSVDPDIMPQGAIERVEVVTDGGSATYGADAVGGVINFVTRKRYDGVKVDARYGFGDDYWTTDANIIAGKDWGSGSLYAAYSFQKNNSFRGSDRDFVKSIDWNTGRAIGKSCNPGNVSVTGATGTTNYALPGLVPGSVNTCDSTDDATAFPASERHSAMVGLHQDLTDGLRIDLRAFWAKRSSSSSGPLRGQATVRATNAYYMPVTPGSTANQVVSFTLAPLLGIDSAPSGSSFQEWGTNAEVTADISSNWEFRGLLNYSQTSSQFTAVGLNQTLMSRYGTGNVLNPADNTTSINFYNPAATSNLDLIRQIANTEQAGQSRDHLFQARAIVSGTLFKLPGGDVKLAAGYEYLQDNFSQRVAPTDQPRGSIRGVAWTPYGRSAHSVFGELQVPIFGEDNRTGGIYSLLLSASARYDHFSDFGASTNPKFGIIYKPVSWFGLRGNYSTSFNAPSPVDQLGSARNTLTLFPLNAFIRPGDSGANAPTVTNTLALQGATAGLRPQTASTWSIGADIDPPFIPGLHASISYYTVKFNDLLTIPPSNSTIFSGFPNNVITNTGGVTVQQLLNQIPTAPNGASVVNQVISGNCATPGVLTSQCNVYEIVDFRAGNFGTLKVRGLDFDVRYRRATGFGGIDASVSGNYQLERTQQVGPGAAATDVLQYDTPRLTMQTTLGADIGNFRAQLTMNHVSGFAVQRSAVLPQDQVGAFDIFNLFFKYNVPSESRLLKDLSFTFNLNNVFDTDPPVFKSNAVGQGNGYPQAEFTLGRVVMFGASKKF